jgi:carbonic anhydrase/acetyltransferase-like protein (isoleucine patch superfamily)
MPLYELDGKGPRIADDVFVAPSASVIGNVTVGSGSSIWFGAVVRGDFSSIEIGEGTCVQDNAVLHCAHELPTLVGDDVTIAHGAMLEGCVVDDGALVGMGAIVLQRARVGARSMLAAGTVVLEGQEIPAGVLAAGAPAVVKKELSGSAQRWVEKAAAEYRQLTARYREEAKRW